MPPQGPQPPPRCGDSNVDAAFGETCDDGNTTSGDGCSATCQDESQTCSPGWYLDCGDTDSWNNGSGGSTDVLEAGGGTLVPLDGESALTTSLESFLVDSEAASALGREARSVILEHYSFGRIGDRYRALYELQPERERSGEH